MPRKPAISPSKISTYLACPVRYRWTYIDGRGRWYQKAKWQYSFGQTLHKVLERFYAEDRTGVMTREEVAAAYEQDWVSAGYSSQDEMMEAQGEGLAMLERHVAEAYERPRVGKTFLLEKTLKLDMGDFDLIGRLDRVDEMPDGSLEIIDYKTQRDDVTEEEVVTHLAMSIYQLLLRRQYPERAVRATIVALRSGKRASAALSDEDLVGLEADLRMLGGEMLRDDYLEIEPRLKPLCRNCDFVPLCRKHPEFEESWTAWQTA